PPVQNRHTPGIVGPLGTSSTSSMTEPSGNSPDEPVLVPPRQCPPTPVRPETPPFWERRPLETSTPRAAIGLDVRATDKLRGPAIARPPQGSRAMRNSGSLSQRA